MTILTFLLQAVASLLAIITFLIVLNVQRSMLIPGGVLGMAIWLLYLLLKGPTNVIIATFVAAIIGPVPAKSSASSIKHQLSSLFWPF